MCRTIAVLTSVVLLTLRVSAGGAPVTSVTDFDHSSYDRILASIVVGDSVDYRRLRDEHLAALDSYLDRMAGIDPQAMPESDRLAFYINLYNATVLSAVAQRYRRGYSVAENDFELFDQSLVRFAGKAATLNDLEHRLIRKQFPDPRVHAVLVCAARSCPPLAGRAYSGSTLDAELDRRMRSFLGDPARNLIDPTDRRLALSQIFEWYVSDFGGEEALAGYVGRFTDVDVETFRVSYRPYSWELNDADR